LFTDAKFLHKELSGLKNVMASMGMLETVVSEKQIARANISSPSPMSPQVTPPKRSNTMTANQRLKGLLSRSSTITSKSVIPDQVTSPKLPMSPSPPLPPAMLTLGSNFASPSTSTLASDGASMSTQDLNMLRDPILGTSPTLPPIDGFEDKSDRPAGFLSPSQQYEIKAVDNMTRTQAPLPEIPDTEKEPEVKVRVSSIP
jgi:vacuolar protein sorting-associated protein 54